MPGAAGPAWVLGSSPHGPKLLNGDVQGDNQGSEFFVGKQIQFPCFPKKKKKNPIIWECATHPRIYIRGAFLSQIVRLLRLIQLYFVKFSGFFDGKEEGKGSGVRGSSSTLANQN